MSSAEYPNLSMQYPQQVTVCVRSLHVERVLFVWLSQRDCRGRLHRALPAR